MPRTKKPRIRKRIPAHKRIPPEHGHLTWSARQLYDLIFSFGLGSCWMSNSTIAGKLRCCKRTVQYARQQLVKTQVIITARTCPHTWAMWARYHIAVQNCQTLLYPIRQKMDNPYYQLGCKSVEVQNPAHWGANFAPKLDVNTSIGIDRESPNKESAIQPPTTPSSRDSVPNPASPSGLTGNRWFNGEESKTQPSQPTQPAQNSPGEDKRLNRAHPDLDTNGVRLYRQFYDNFIAQGASEELACKDANTNALLMQEKLKRR